MPQLNTKTMVQFSYSRLYLGIKTISYRLLQGIGRMGMDWDLKKLYGPTLSSSNATPAKITENNIMVSASLNSRRPFRVTYSRKEIHAKKKDFRQTKKYRPERYVYMVQSCFTLESSCVKRANC